METITTTNNRNVYMKLSKKQEREIETFEKQCNVSLDGYDYVLKQAIEQEQRDIQELHYKQREAEREALLNNRGA